MRQLVLGLIKVFHIAYIVMTYSVDNPNTFGFALLRNFSF
jgi:hypothetical protein